MTSDEYHEFEQLDFGRTNGTNLPGMTLNKLFDVAYNHRYGLVTVCEDNGELHFDGRVNIESLLSRIQSEDRKTIDKRVYGLIMESYSNLQDYRSNPENYESTPETIMEVLVDKTGSL